MNDQIKVIVRNEILHQILSGRFVVCLILCVTLASLTAFVSRVNYENDLSSYHQRVQNHRRDAGTYGTASGSPLFLLEWGGVMIDRPLQPSHVVALSLLETVSESFWVNKEAGVRPVTPMPAVSLASLFQGLDLLFLLTYVFSLIALIFSYDSVCGERESGTLALCMSHNLSRAQYLVGKVLGGLAVQALFLLITISVSLLIFSLSASLQIDFPFLARMAVLGGLSLLYVSVFYALGTLVSTYASSSTGAIVICLACWLIFTSFVPAFAPVVAEAASPLPFYKEVVEAESSSLGFDFMKKVEEYRRQGAQDPFAEAGKYKETIIDPEKAVHQQRIREEFTNKKWEQVNRTERIMVFSPTSNFQIAAANLLGIGPLDLYRFDLSVERYRQELVTYIRAKKDEAGPEENRGNIDTSDYPKFSFNPAPFSEVWASDSLHVGVMTGIAIALLAMSYWSFRTYDVR